MGVTDLNNSKAKFILKNFIKVLLLLFAVSVAAFALMTASPIDPPESERRTGCAWKHESGTDRKT